jgi:hypothetical protein
MANQRRTHRIITSPLFDPPSFFLSGSKMTMQGSWTVPLTGPLLRQQQKQQYGHGRETLVESARRKRRRRQGTAAATANVEAEKGKNRCCSGPTITRRYSSSLDMDEDGECFPSSFSSSSNKRMSFRPLFNNYHNIVYLILAVTTILSMVPNATALHWDDIFYLSIGRRKRPAFSLHTAFVWNATLTSNRGDPSSLAKEEEEEETINNSTPAEDTDAADLEGELNIRVLARLFNSNNDNASRDISLFSSSVRSLIRNKINDLTSNSNNSDYSSLLPRALSNVNNATTNVTYTSRLAEQIRSQLPSVRDMLQRNNMTSINRTNIDLFGAVSNPWNIPSSYCACDSVVNYHHGGDRAALKNMVLRGVKRGGAAAGRISDHLVDWSCSATTLDRLARGLVLNLGKIVAFQCLTTWIKARDFQTLQEVGFRYSLGCIEIFFIPSLSCCDYHSSHNLSISQTHMYLFLNLTQTSFRCSLLFMYCFLQLADRLLSEESAMAVKTIRNILVSAEDHGVVDVFSKYPSQEIVASFYALYRLQRAARYYAENSDSTNPTEIATAAAQDHPEDLLHVLEDLSHYVVFASAAYGWKMDLAFQGKLHLGDEKALLKKTGIDKDDIVMLSLKSKAHLPVSSRKERLSCTDRMTANVNVNF